MSQKEQLADYFEHSLQQECGQYARQYLESRGINEETIKKFRLGYCPDDWQGNAIWKRRLIFPLIDSYGHVIAFNGRLCTYKAEDKYGGKYIKELGTDNVIKHVSIDGNKYEKGMIWFHDSFHKNYFLYGLYQAKQNIIENNYVIIVEGPFDNLIMSQEVIPNSVATMGSALTEFHICMLYRYCDLMIFAFDADEGGTKALERAEKRATFDCEALLWPDGYDPHEFILEKGGTIVKEKILEILKDKKKTFIQIEKENFTKASEQIKFVDVYQNIE